MARLREPRRSAQRVDIVRQKAASPVQQIDGEEPASARHRGTAITRHRGNDRLAWMPAAGRVGQPFGRGAQRRRPHTAFASERRNALRL